MTSKIASQISGIRLSERERAALSKAMGIHGGAERRRHRRYMLPKEFTLVVRIHQPGGTASIFSVTPRDLSTSGLGFFHAAYIHPGTECTLMMRSLKGEPVSLKATVMRCRHVSGRIHEVGALFEHEVDTGTFVADHATPVDETAKGALTTLEDVHSRLSELAAELKGLAEHHAAPGVLLAKVGEIAILLSPPEPTAEAPIA